MQVFKNWFSHCFFLERNLHFPYLSTNFGYYTGPTAICFAVFGFCYSLPKGGDIFFSKGPLTCWNSTNKICLLSKRSNESLVLLYWVRVYLVHSWFMVQLYTWTRLNYLPTMGLLLFLSSFLDFSLSIQRVVVQKSVLFLFR